MSLPDLAPLSWLLCYTAAFCSGMSKSGLSGISMLGVVLMARAMDSYNSTGVVLPLLIFADVLAASNFRSEIQWGHIRRLAVPIGIGILGGWWFMLELREHREQFRPIVGGIVLLMVALQLLRQRFSRLDQILPNSQAFGVIVGFFVGFSTMVANAAGPIASLYLLMMALPKGQLVHTMAWLFLFVNIFKVPFSWHLGLIHVSSLTLNICLIPSVVAGLYFGKWLIPKIPQNLFQNLVTLLAGISALDLLFR
jgi:uncharacterized protein